jgi:hypothetical protein
MMVGSLEGGIERGGGHRGMMTERGCRELWLSMTSPCPMKTVDEKNRRQERATYY